MALYAFDGTGNVDEDLPELDTNVIRFKELYAGVDVEYLEGVGTRWKAVGKVLGGLFGMGGRTRIDEMYDDLCENWSEGDRDIDIIGFSRGAALALHFANKVADDGVKLESGESAPATIRFLGLWDVVGSFGLLAKPLASRGLTRIITCPMCMKPGFGACTATLVGEMETQDVPISR